MLYFIGIFWHGSRPGKQHSVSMAGVYKQLQFYIYGQTATMTDIHVLIYCPFKCSHPSVCLFVLPPSTALLFHHDYAKSLGIPVKALDTAQFFLFRFFYHSVCAASELSSCQVCSSLLPSQLVNSPIGYPRCFSLRPLCSFLWFFWQLCIGRVIPESLFPYRTYDCIDGGSFKLSYLCCLLLKGGIFSDSYGLVGFNTDA